MAFLLVLFLVGTSSYVDKNIIGVLLEQIKAEFQVSDTLLGVLSGASFALFYATLGIPIARWADYGDRKLIITLALSTWSVMTALCGAANSFWQLAAARFGVGAGEAGAIPPAQSLIADYFPPGERARAIGVFMTAASAGYAIGLVFGGRVAQHYGWRAAFIAVGLLSLVLVVLTRSVLKEPRSVVGAVRPTGSEPLRVAAKALFAKPSYRSLAAALIIYFFWTYGVLVFIVSLLMRVHGLSVAQAGTLFGTVSAVGALIGCIGGGALADRLARRNISWLARLGAYGMIAAIPLYELALWSAHVGTMIPLLLLGTVVLNAAVPPAYSAVHAVCGSSRRALAIALLLFLANLLGLGLGPVAAGALSDAFGVLHGPGEGLRRSLMVLMSALLPAAWLLFRAARGLGEDAEP